MKPRRIAIVGAAETTELGKLPHMSQIQLHADAALNAMADCGLKPSDIDGVATAGQTPTEVAHYLGITPKWVDGAVRILGRVGLLDHHRARHHHHLHHKNLLVHLHQGPLADDSDLADNYLSCLALNRRLDQDHHRVT